MKAFEVHVQQGERWRIDSVFDDRDLALLEAQRPLAERQVPRHPRHRGGV